MILDREQTLSLRSEHQVPEALYRAIDDVGTTLGSPGVSRCTNKYLGVTQDDVKMLTQLVATDRNSVGWPTDEIPLLG